MQPLMLRNVRVNPPLALAPMVGLSHSALRSLVHQLGGIGLFFTEMLSVKRLPSENAQRSPYLIRTAEENPLFYQLYCGPDDEIQPAIDRLTLLGADGVDINLGCPAPQLRKIKAGQYLFDDPLSVRKVVKSIRKLSNLPLSIKIRLGSHPDSAVLLDTCRMFEQEGVDMITIHTRLAHEKFCRKPRWHLLEGVCSKVAIPILANGGIFSVEDARNCLEQTGAAGLMIGRGAATRPWIFHDIASALYGYRSEVSRPAPEGVYFTFLQMVVTRFPPERQLGRIKEFTHYFAQPLPFGHGFAVKVQNSRSIDEAQTHAEKFFAQLNHQNIRGGSNDRACQKSNVYWNRSSFSDQRESGRSSPGVR